MKEAEIRETLRYHKTTPVKVSMHEDVRHLVTETTCAVAAIIPYGRERSLFITAMQQAMMWANAAIAIHVPGDDGR